MNNTRWTTVAGKDVEAKTSEHAIEAAGLNWKVMQSSILFHGLGGKAQSYSDKMVNWRADNGEVLGVVGKGYRVLQNREAFTFLDSLIGYAEAMYTNAGCFRGGAHVYIQAKLPGEIRFDDGGEDVGEKFITFITSHDGGLPVSVMFTPVRIICQNTLLMALRDNVRKTSIRHTLNLAMGLKEAKETLGILNNQFTLLESLSQKMTKTAFRDVDVPQLVQKAGLITTTTDSSSRAQNIIKEVLERFHSGAGSNLKSANGTVWGAYNAITEYVDHYRINDPMKRAASSILGSGAEIKEKAFALLSSI